MTNTHALIAAAALTLSPAWADTPLPETLRFFNDCAGRMAGHLTAQAGSVDRQNIRGVLEGLDTLVAALSTPDLAPRLRDHQSAARAAHLALLAHAMEQGDLWAMRRAQAEIDRCRAAVLPMPEAAHRG